MANMIRHLCEPDRLYLAWQAPDGVGTRFRWAVATVVPSTDGCRLRYLIGDEFKAANQGLDHSELASLGYQGYPAFNPRRLEHSDGVLEAFLRRLPPRNRPDYAAYQSQFRIDPEAKPSDLAMLAATEAKLPSDGFSLVDTLNPNSSSCDLLLEIAGFRHYADKVSRDLEIGQPVEVLPEPDNEYDPGAVVVRAHGERLGYINRLQAPTFLRWLAERNVVAEIERLNGSRDKPRAFIFVRVRPTEQSRAA
jgi:hypothetical protein